MSRLQSSLGELYLKAAEPGAEHSARVAQLMADRVPGRVPEVVATDAIRGWWLTRPVHRAPVARGTTSMDEASAVLAEVQVASVSWIADLVRAGCPDMTPQALARDAVTVITADPVMKEIAADQRPILARGREACPVVV